MFLSSLIDDDTSHGDVSFLVFELFVLKWEETAKERGLLTVNAGLGFPKHDFQTPPLRVKILPERCSEHLFQGINRKHVVFVKRLASFEMMHFINALKFGSPAGAYLIFIV
jgi:hypothetical protein